MPRRKYNAAQAAALELVETVHAEHIEQKLKLRQQIAKAFADRMIDLELKKSRAMNAALALGVAKTDLGRAIGTSNFETIRDLLARTAGDVTAEDLYRDPLDERYTFDLNTETLTVTLDADEAAHGAKNYGWTESAARGLDLAHASFRLESRADGTQYLDPVTELATAEHGWFMHPAVCWVTRNKEHEAEALAYAVAHQEAQ